MLLQICCAVVPVRPPARRRASPLARRSLLARSPSERSAEALVAPLREARSRLGQVHLSEVSQERRRRRAARSAAAERSRAVPATCRSSTTGPSRRRRACIATGDAAGRARRARGSPGVRAGPRRALRRRLAARTCRCAGAARSASSRSSSATRRATLRRRRDRAGRDARQPGRGRPRPARVRAPPRRPRRARRRADPRGRGSGRLARARGGARDARARGRPRASAAQLAGVYLADGSGGGVATAGHNTPEDWTGIVLSRGEGVAGRVLDDRARRSSPTRTGPRSRPPHKALGEIQTAAGVPMVWDGELKGALSVGFTDMRRVTDEDLRDARGDRRARRHRLPQRRGLRAWPASPPPPTRSPACINHGALHLRMREEISRARRQRDAARLPADRPRRLQGGQRRARPPGRRRACCAAWPPPCAPSCATTTSIGPLRRRRVRRAAPRRRRRRRPRRRRPDRGALRRCACSIGVSPVGRAAVGRRAAATAPTARCCWPSAPASSAWRSPAPTLEQELELIEARAGSPEAIMREFWEMVAGVRVEPRDALLTLPAFLRRTLGAEEVALYELAGDGDARARRRRARARRRASSTRSTSTRVPATPRCASGSRSARSRGRTLDGILLAALGARRHCPSDARRAGRLLRRRAAAVGGPPARADRGAHAARAVAPSGCASLELLWRARRWRCCSAQPDGRLARRGAGARGRDRGARQLHARALRAGRLARHRRRARCSASPPPRSTRSATARCCTTSASSRSPTRSSTSPAR